MHPSIVENNGETFVRYTSTRKPTREDCMELQRSLERKFELRQASSKGVCPVRSELYSQAMDELIRQVTVLEPDRGLLLLRVRDQQRVSSDAYRTLSEGSIAFAAQKQTAAVERVAGLPEYIGMLEARREELETKRHSLSHKVAVLEARALQDQLLSRKKRAQTIRHLKVTRATLDQFNGAVDNDPTTNSHHNPEEGK
jgi:dynein light intermediate chain|tara:strand:+ start:218 stop:811 length:594 start_codon:yes stop_codon:yes gene_type:complete